MHAISVWPAALTRGQSAGRPAWHSTFGSASPDTSAASRAYGSHRHGLHAEGRRGDTSRPVAPKLGNESAERRRRPQNIWPIEKCQRTPVSPKLRGNPRSMRIGARGVLMRSPNPVQVFGRLADGASWQDAAAEADVVSARLAADQPTTHAQLRTRLRAFAGRTPGDPLRLEDLAVHGIVLLLLGAVSANVATLIFARTAIREAEVVVRHALGRAVMPA